jgi:hypothetical protein
MRKHASLTWRVSQLLTHAQAKRGSRRTYACRRTRLRNLLDANAPTRTGHRDESLARITNEFTPGFARWQFERTQTTRAGGAGCPRLPRRSGWANAPACPGSTGRTRWSWRPSQAGGTGRASFPLRPRWSHWSSRPRRAFKASDQRKTYYQSEKDKRQTHRCLHNQTV